MRDEPDEPHWDARPRERGGDVAVAGDDAGGLPRADGEQRGRYLADVTGMGAEAKGHAEASRGVRGHRRRTVGEVAVHGGDRSPPQALDEMRPLRSGAPRTEHLDPGEQPGAAGVLGAVLAALGREDRG